MDELDFKKAPQSNLHTWSGVIRLFAYSTAAIAVVLLLMAAALL